MLLKIDLVIIETLNFKFENVSFTKLPKKYEQLSKKNMLEVAPEFFWVFWVHVPGPQL